MKIYALHGFLGKPSDWNFLPFEDCDAIDLFANPILPFWEWAKHFNQTVLKDAATERLLIGYSLGGRLALHALIENPTLWKQAYICSSHAGLQTIKEKNSRKMYDQKWADRYLKESWDLLMFDWNNQGVFRGNQELVRQEEDFDRRALSSAIQIWSLGNQDYLVPLLNQINIPITWITGEYDEKYTLLSRDYAHQITHSSHLTIPQSGHRVIFDQQNSLQSFFLVKKKTLL